MDFSSPAESVRQGQGAKFSAQANALEYAQSLDAQDPIRHLREQFIFPTKASIQKRALDGSIPGVSSKAETQSGDGTENGSSSSSEPMNSDGNGRAIYFCGNSLGLQPKAVRTYLHAQLETWASIGVYGHFRDLERSPLKNWQDMAEGCARQSASIVGAAPEEIVIMNSLTVNLQLLMASFYRPMGKRYKIILEWKPFPSDYYAISSHLQWHQLNPSKSMVELNADENMYISTDKVLATIDEHGEETALILLPGIQYYSGQLFDIPRITKYAQERGIVVGWDLAHAAGNVELHLHDWNVDFAAWCTYKYLNAGPGAIAGAFIHERHGKVEWVSEKDDEPSRPVFRPRLSGWYGGDKSVRFNMAKQFQPTPGAAGYQLSNPSAIDLAALSGSLSVFNMTDMKTLRSKSLLLTAYAEKLLNSILAEDTGPEPSFRIITPSNPDERGAQLSVLLRAGLLDNITQALEGAGVICDKRKPDVIRVAPVPLYNTFEDVWRCISAIRQAITAAR